MDYPSMDYQDIINHRFHGLLDSKWKHITQWKLTILLFLWNLETTSWLLQGELITHNKLRIHLWRHGSLLKGTAWQDFAKQEQANFFQAFKCVGSYQPFYPLLHLIMLPLYVLKTKRCQRHQQRGLVKRIWRTPCMNYTKSLKQLFMSSRWVSKKQKATRDQADSKVWFIKWEKSMITN